MAQPREPKMSAAIAQPSGRLAGPSVWLVPASWSLPASAGPLLASARKNGDDTAAAINARRSSPDAWKAAWMPSRSS